MCNYFKQFISDNYEALLDTVRALCRIPAPSGMETERAQFCRDWLLENGAKGVYIDEALNVVFPYRCDTSDKITVLAAHTDTVFPDLAPMELSEDENNIYSPGVGDNTASVAVLLMTAKYFIENNIDSPRGILFVCNSCEEGLGNLKGTRHIMTQYGAQIAQFISLDSFQLHILHDKCVGSHRYEVEVITEGGHSFGAFGNYNAICELSKIVTAIYELQVPHIGNSRTTYNVGNIEGGTSVNTIAQYAKILCEYRSDNVDCLDIMKKRFEEIFLKAQKDGVTVKVKNIGERPCEKGVNPQSLQALCTLCKEIIHDVSGREVKFTSASTDCNIPLSMGIPSACISVYDGAGAHTREEWINKASLRQGLEIAIRCALLK